MRLAPRQHLDLLTSLPSSERASLAAALGQIVRAYDRVLGRAMPYVMALHQGPSVSPMGGFHWHFEFLPRARSKDQLKFPAGAELGAGLYLMDLDPQACSQALRSAISSDLGGG